MDATDWQISRNEIRERGKYLLQNVKFSDCNFLIGTEPNQEILPAHKLILASASPVFEAMFYGQLAEKKDPIPILDVQIDAFKAILEYIYTDNIFINSVEKACEICYGAKKYMLPYVVEKCTEFLWSDLSPKNACRAYEFAKLFEEPLLLVQSLQIVCTKTLEVLTNPSFEEIEFSTFMKILDQEYLNIDSELDLFFALTRYFDKHHETTTQDSITTQQSTSTESGSKDDSLDLQEATISQRSTNIRNAIKKLRFLTLSPQQFADGPGRSTFLDQTEAFAILMNVSSPNSTFPMPEGFSSNRNPRVEKYTTVTVSESPSPVIVPVIEPLRYPLGYVGNPAINEGRDMVVETRKYYCVRTIRQQTDCLNTSALDCSVTFNVDRSICITGVQVPTQVFGDTNMQRPYSDRYSEILYAHLLDSHGSRLTYTHCTSRVRFDSLMEISFDRPVYIQSQRMYKIGVVFNKVGWYPMCKCVPTATCDNVFFSFGVGSPNESIRDGLIRAIVFTYTSDGV